MGQHHRVIRAVSTRPHQAGRRALYDGLAGARQTDSCLPKRHAALRRLDSWVDRMSIFFEGCQKPVEYIFKNKFYLQEPQQEIPFTRDEVRDAIIATGGQVPSNLNNFMKDLSFCKVKIGPKQP